MSSVTIEISHEQYARMHFEQFLTYNGRSVLKDEDGEYLNRSTNDLWKAYKSGFRRGAALFGHTASL